MGKNGVLELDMKKTTSKINGEVDYNVGDRFLQHELQMQQMAENIEGIMQMIVHRLDSLEKRIHRVIIIIIFI